MSRMKCSNNISCPPCSTGELPVKASSKNIKKLAQLMLRTKGFYRGEIDGVWGKG